MASLGSLAFREGEIMKHFVVPHRITLAVGIAAIASLLHVPAASAASSGISAPAASPPAAQTLQARTLWRKQLRLARLPHRGCFETTYPSTQWREVPCKAVPLRPYPPRQNRPQTVGGGSNDFAATVPGKIFSAGGSFSSVTGVTSETGSVGGANSFSLQLNTNLFKTATCAGAKAPDCMGWQQFVYSSSGALLMQYWLLDFGGTCPAGWASMNTTDNPNDCFRNGPNSAQPDGANIGELSGLSIMVSAQTGGDDTIIFTKGGTATAFSNDDALLQLAQGWNTAEFNVFGDCCNSTAKFNNGANIVVTTSVNDGSLSAPGCQMESFTGETNNLSLSSTPVSIPAEPEPRIEFTERSPQSPPALCSRSGGNAQDQGVVYRWYLSANGDHFYTEDPTGELAPGDHYVFEGRPFSLFAQGTSGTTAFFRWYSPGNGHHFYTADPTGEKAPDAGYRPEGILGFIATSKIAGTRPLFRWYKSDNGDHFYTTDPSGEKAPAAGYHFEKIAGFVKSGP
jgi:hypothetical protein